MSTTEPRAAKRSDPRFARPDASMSLLLNVAEHSLDEGYAEAAARRGAVGSSRLPTTTRGRVVFGVGLALVAALLAMGVSQVQANAPVAAQERQALIDRINTATSAADAAQQQLGQLQTQLAQAQADALAGKGGSARLAEQQLVSGQTPVSGPGLQVTVDDAASAGTDLNNASPRTNAGFGNTGRVRDSDLQLVVNALWQSGAEAIAINDERLGNLSSIRAAGDAILVNNSPLTLPYTIQAIGGPGLQQAFAGNADGGLYLAELNKGYQIRYSTTSAGALQLPAAPPVRLINAQPAPSKGTTHP
ncbi:DUF881 domain-containing protein [Streptacidiphilus fuscans]|nr:DUF881 domain-containing protein [Streptacidiphilus fuscans]